MSVGCFGQMLQLGKFRHYLACWFEEVVAGCIHDCRLDRVHLGYVGLWWVTMFAWPWDEHISTLLHRGFAQVTSSTLTTAALPLDRAVLVPALDVVAVAGGAGQLWMALARRRFHNSPDNGVIFLLISFYRSGITDSVLDLDIIWQALYVAMCCRWTRSFDTVMASTHAAPLAGPAVSDASSKNSSFVYVSRDVDGQTCAFDWRTCLTITSGRSRFLYRPWRCIARIVDASLLTLTLHNFGAERLRIWGGTT